MPEKTIISRKAKVLLYHIISGAGSLSINDVFVSKSILDKIAEGATQEVLTDENGNEHIGYNDIPDDMTELSDEEQVLARRLIKNANTFSPDAAEPLKEITNILDIKLK